MKFGVFVFVIMSLCLMFATYGQTKPMQGLVLYLPFDEGKGADAEDFSGRGNDGVLKGNPRWVDGKYGSALQFIGAENKNYVEIQDNPDLNPATEITLAAWIFIDDFIGSGGIISKYIGAGNQRGYSMRTDHTIAFSIASDTSIDGTYNAGKFTTTSSAANSVEPGEWQHIAVTFKGGKFHRVYVNGEISGETEAGVIDSLFDNNVPLLIGTDFQIGAAGNSGPREFTGLVDEVVVFNRALSDDEISTIMTGRLGIISVEPQDKLASTWGELKR